MAAQLLKSRTSCMNEYLHCTGIEQSDRKGKLTVRYFSSEDLPFSFRVINQQHA